MDSAARPTCACRGQPARSDPNLRTKVDEPARNRRATPHEYCKKAGNCSAVPCYLSRKIRTPSVVTGWQLMQELVASASTVSVQRSSVQLSPDLTRRKKVSRSHETPSLVHVAVGSPAVLLSVRVWGGRAFIAFMETRLGCKGKPKWEGNTPRFANMPAVVHNADFPTDTRPLMRPPCHLPGQQLGPGLARSGGRDRTSKTARPPIHAPRALPARPK
jgi:hypothetical protein